MTSEYVVEVNECGIFASRKGVDWWTENILKRRIGDRIKWLTITPGGGVGQIPCADKEDAEFLYGYMVEHGIHAKHAKVKRA